MSILADSVAGYMQNASWIRRMFEAGGQLKARYGADKVYDFSLGNPDLPAPPAVANGLREFAAHAEEPFAFGYMPNGGFAWAREKLAAHLSKEQGVPLAADAVILGCGAAGMFNAFLRAVINPGEEMLGIAPYFVEYGFYVANHGGTFRAVMSKPDTFAPDIAALEEAIGPRTRVLLINSPNNPTGAVYSRKELQAIASLLETKSQQYGRPIWLVADEPYRFLAYDGAEVPSVLPLYPYAVVISSFSKNLSLPGERVGYAAVSPLLGEKDELMAALALTNRILGFVNPPVVGQHIMAAALGSQVALEVYAARRKAMAEVLSEAGYEFHMPAGAFYFFPKAPGGDDVAFVNALLEERVLAVPGSGFGCPGYFRLAFCVEEKVIRNAAEGFAKARAKL
ncbi:pyridoxal phosphate-dependent aminotransferase [uncultured Desulfovibrio sp.]|uniref:pyridoxal phosphate-dependent aminotransferase n=1 Tax=uncultured Desulfovibrio sp. TaxID=167968 RepID=UPI001B0981E0|nr:pyridoxal phosphate-dependent aminotransferase [uncultured Desulfovibrio sp.]MBO5490997.1 pyridoxal phosphate-dependent aminotransferase [Desulfovibrio sp.]